MKYRKIIFNLLPKPGNVMAKKEKYQFEFLINVSPAMLYQYLTSPSALAQWFADDVVFRGGNYVFIWGDTREKAKLARQKKNEQVRFQWLDADGNKTDYFTEFRIMVDDLTDDVSLLVTDFSDDGEEETQLLWENMIDDLRHILGVH